jgi:hypothetical protein
MGLISWFKGLFGSKETVAEVAHKVEEVAEVVAEVAHKVEEVAEVKTEVVVETPTKAIEERLAEVAKEEKVTAKEIKAKVRKPATPKVVVETEVVAEVKKAFTVVLLI